MKKIIILIPIYNDWQSLIKLLDQINDNITSFKEIKFEIIVINDASSISQPNILKPKNIESIIIMNMKKNKGHARCIAFGIRYISSNLKFDNLILMDGDGEDRPIEIKSMINEILKNPNISVVAKRIKRSEGFFFKFCYQMHKIITYIFTGKKINFGNYSCLKELDVKALSNKTSLWSSYSGTLKKEIENFAEIDSIRGTRFFGPSQMSILKLIIHSLSIIAVFKFQVFFRCFLLLLTISFLKIHIGEIATILQILIATFILLIFSVSLREQKEQFINSQNNLKDINKI